MLKGFDPQEIADRIIELYGSRDAFYAEVSRGAKEIDALWNQDRNTLGSILKSHLFVEHFLTAYLKSRNPNLGDTDTARLSFAQKAALAHNPKSAESHLFLGIRHLNRIRNRIVHQFASELTERDSEIFLGIALFREFRNALAKPGMPSNDPLDVLEDFAQHAGLTLQLAANTDDRFERAIRGE